MEFLQILRNHIKNNVPDVETFSTILNNIEKQLTTDLKNELHNDQYIARCIDLEGLDGCGKSTLAKELIEQLNKRGKSSRLLISPPDQLLPFRSYFDSQPESIRRAYYNLGNIIVSYDLKNQSDQIITILDRYWPSTIAYQLAGKTENMEIDLSWPKHLVQPALIVYIYVDENERCRRIKQRSTSVAVTQEEIQLAEKVAFRERLDFIYQKKIPSTRLHVVDGNRSPDIIANDILNLLQE